MLAMYMRNIKASNTPPILPKGMERSTYAAKSEVTVRRIAVYIFVFLSKQRSMGEKINPRLKAPRMLDMDDPSTALN